MNNKSESLAGRFETLARVREVLSLRKMLGRLEDAGNATTIAHYLDLLEAAGLVSGLQKYSGQSFRRRASSPKLQVHNNALMSAMSEVSFAEARSDPELWGRWQGLRRQTRQGVLRAVSLQIYIAILQHSC